MFWKLKKYPKASSIRMVCRLSFTTEASVTLAAASFACKISTEARKLHGVQRMLWSSNLYRAVLSLLVVQVKQNAFDLSASSDRLRQSCERSMRLSLDESSVLHAPE